MLSLKKNLSEGLSSAASATTSAATSAASATTNAASNAASASQSALQAVAPADLDGLRSSLSNMSPVEQLKEIKEKQGEKFSATSSQLMSILNPTE
ncbi:hypothetical protein TrRE_jg12797, partial [Triparma retinervis]